MTDDLLLQEITQQKYKYGFTIDIEADQAPKGLTEDTIRFISAKKNEPEWMLNIRLRAFRHWLKMTEPNWAKIGYPSIDYQDIIYYSAPKPKLNSLDEVDPEILKSFEKLGIPLDERKALAGVAVDAVVDSVSVKTTFKGKLAEKGVIFCSLSEAIQEHPELIKKYLGKVVPYTDNFFAALNTAVFTDGSFVYIPKGVRCPMELSTYFRINEAKTGQFERTLIIAEEGAYVSYLEGCHPAGEQVLTTNGWQNIETIKVGDFVLDHLGKKQKVNAAMMRNYKGELLTIRPVSRYNEFRLTTEHPVLTIKRNDVLIKRARRNEAWLPEVDTQKLLQTEAKWLPAKELEAGDFMLVPKLASKSINIFTDEEVELQTETHFIVPIREITSEPYEDLVFNLDVAETHSYLVSGFAVHNCTAPMRDENQLHAAVVELVAMEKAEIKYSTVQNWYPGDENGKGGIYNFVTKRGSCEGAYSKISWTQVETGSAITWKYPSVMLKGDNSVGEFYSVALTNNWQQADTGTKMIHIGKNTKSVIVSKGISAGKSNNAYRGQVKMMKSATNSRNFSQCDSLLIGDKCGAHTFPYIESANSSSVIEHEATTSKIGEDQIFYCNQRGIDTETAVSLIVNGFTKEVLKQLPMEFAVEAQKLLAVSLEGSVG